MLIHAEISIPVMHKLTPASVIGHGRTEGIDKRFGGSIQSVEERISRFDFVVHGGDNAASSDSSSSLMIGWNR
jgi:tRNA G37 N-methylase TrmD